MLKFDSISPLKISFPIKNQKLHPQVDQIA